MAATLSSLRRIGVLACTAYAIPSSLARLSSLMIFAALVFLVAGLPAHADSATVRLVIPAEMRQGDLIAAQRVASAIEARLGLREVEQATYSLGSPARDCAGTTEYGLEVVATTLRPIERSDDGRVDPQISAQLRRCADGFEVRGFRTADVKGAATLTDPAITSALRGLERLVVNDIVVGVGTKGQP